MKEFIKRIKDNRKMSIIIGLFVIAIVATLVFLLTKNTFATVEEDTVSISCSPSVVSPGDQITCSLNGDFAVNTIKGMSANYDNTSGLIYNEFIVKANWQSFSNNSNGFSLLNLNGSNGVTELATIKFTIPDSASSNDIFTVKLVNVDISDGNATTRLEDISTEVRVKSSVNTLNSLKVNNETLTLGENDTYSATVDSDKATISVVKTDNNSTVSGDGQVTLHYGTNSFSITVTSEIGVDKTYNVLIYRPFEFTTDTYSYNKTNNYIYTKSDVDSNTIISNLNADIPSDLNANINNNKLVIKYGNDILADINLINFSLIGLTVANGNIYVGDGVSYASFMNSITTNGVSVKVYNGTTEITSSNMEENYKVKIYYSNTEALLEEYTIIKEIFTIDSSLDVDNTLNIIGRLVNGNTYTDVVNKMTTNGTFSMTRSNTASPKTALSNTDKFITGDKFVVNMVNGNKFEYTISVLGDLTGGTNNNDRIVGNGIIDNGDVSLLYRYLKGKATLENYQLKAGDIINDGVIKINDISRLYRYYKGKVNTLEVE